MRRVCHPRTPALLALLLLAPGLLAGVGATSEPADAPWGEFRWYARTLHGDHLSAHLEDGDLTDVIGGRDGGPLLARLAGAGLTAPTVGPDGRAVFPGDGVTVTAHDTRLRTLLVDANRTNLITLTVPAGGATETGENGTWTLTTGGRIGILHPAGNASIFPMGDRALQILLEPGSRLAITWYAPDDPLLDAARQGRFIADLRHDGRHALHWALDPDVLQGAPTHDGTTWTQSVGPSATPQIVRVAATGLLQGAPRVLLNGTDLRLEHAGNLTRETGAFAVLDRDPAAVAVHLPARDHRANLTLLLDGAAPRVLDARATQVNQTGATLRFHFDEAANVTLELTSLNGNHARHTRSAMPARVHALPLGDLDPGTTYVSRVDAMDAHGNNRTLTGPALRTAAVPEPGDPVITRLEPGWGRSTGATPTLRVNFSDPTGTFDPAEHAWIHLDGENVTAGAAVTDHELRYTPAHPLEPGEHRAEIALVNAEGGRAGTWWTFSVADTTPTTATPAAHAPPLLAVLFAGALLGAAVVYKLRPGGRERR